MDEVSIGSELSGIVADVRVDTNDTVRAGQILATLDADVLEAQAAQSHAAVDAAEATARQARVRVDAARQARERVEALQARGAASAEARDLAVTDYKVAVAALALAEAQLEQSRAADAAAAPTLEGESRGPIRQRRARAERGESQPGRGGVLLQAATAVPGGPRPHAHARGGRGGQADVGSASRPASRRLHGGGPPRPRRVPRRW
ncbi:MAG: biotin/lipoyl-binding protein [Bacteroidales bacterium]|nr:biotin/lipoyl-binding protein [Bacteroidales bacterium]